ncbi:MAG: Holliday junction resolvase RuvX [Bacteroidia bacterium]|nr:Holliday junction resolvase RuvX [Bacteroidia bacterium]MCF8427391.1 Holliday junction resolvase RuvX [Bacteroidia bacterium]MCF8446133.1 Holliday junction resolvase RuvX [Bacteroidia bacterium]
MPRIVAVDYGTKRVGLAVTDPLQIIATTLATVRAHEVLAYLKNYIATEPLECIVVGKPLQMDGTDSQSAKHVEKFVSSLAKNFPDIPIKRIDERLTSRMATASMLEMGLKKKDRQKKETVDQISAVLILQTYLANKF